MVRLSTKYDEELKEQVFMVRGDEDYARSTAVDISIGTPTTTDLDFSVEISVNVLRDRGESSIVIYDDESVLEVIDDWKDTDTGRTITVEHLNYDTEHIFHAKYMGNNKCSPAVSKKIPLMIHDSRITNLTISGGNQFNPNTQITKTITISADYESQPSYFIDQPLLVYYDNVYINTIRTDNQGQASISFNDGDVGFHELRVEYLGSDNLTPQVATMQLSIGYDFHAESYPELIISGGTNVNYTAILKDWFGNPLSNQTVYLQNKVSGNYTDVTSAATNSEGLVELTANIESFRFRVNLNNQNHYTDDITIPNVSINQIAVQADKSHVLKGRECGVTVSLQSNPSSGNQIPITLSGAIDGTIKTNTNGVAKTSITGKGKGNQLIHANCGGKSASLSISDYIQCWEPDVTDYRDYQITGAYIRDATNYMVMPVNGVLALLGFNQLNSDDSKEYALILNGVTSDKNCTIWYVENWNGNMQNADVFYDRIPAPSEKLSNTKVELVKFNNTVQLVYNDTRLIHTWDNQTSNNPCLIFRTDSATKITFNKLTFQEVQ